MAIYQVVRSSASDQNFLRRTETPNEQLRQVLIRSHLWLPTNETLETVCSVSVRTVSKLTAEKERKLYKEMCERSAKVEGEMRKACARQRPQLLRLMPYLKGSLRTARIAFAHNDDVSKGKTSSGKNERREMIFY